MESGVSDLCDCTVAVTAPVEDRVRRIMARDGISAEYALLRANAQKDDAFYRQHCTYVLMNTSDTSDAFQSAALDFFREIIQKASRSMD